MHSLNQRNPSLMVGGRHFNFCLSRTITSTKTSTLKRRLCVAWTAEADNSSCSESEEFPFQKSNLKFRFRISNDEKGSLQLILVKGLVTGPFMVTVLVEKRSGTENRSSTVANARVSKLPWECDAGMHGNIHENGKRITRVHFVIIFEEDSTSVRKDNIEPPIHALENLSLDLANLLKNGTLPDVQLKCGGRDSAIPAHRAVLAARSDVFAAMFRTEMAESLSGDVDLPDMETEVIDPFLQYVYSGKIPLDTSDKVVLGLYVAADKYAVHALREACQHMMVRCLTEENCVNFLTAADAQGDADFKKTVIDYICGHRSVFRGDAWREFAKEQPLLAIEVYQSKVERET